MLSIRSANENDIEEIERMVADFAKGHPAEFHPRSSKALREAYFGDRPVAHLLVAERSSEIVARANRDDSGDVGSGPSWDFGGGGDGAGGD